MAYQTIPPSSGGSSGSGSGVSTDSVVSLSVAGTTLSMGTLNGAVDGGYEIVFELIAGASGTGAIKVQINGADTNLFARWLQQAATLATAGNDTGKFEIMTNSQSAGENVNGRIFVRAIGSDKYISAECTGNTGPVFRHTAGLWTDPGNITGISIVTATAAGLAAGSQALLRKLNLGA